MKVKNIRKLLDSYDDEDKINIFEGNDSYGYPNSSSKIRIVKRHKSSMESEQLLLVGDDYDD